MKFPAGVRWPLIVTGILLTSFAVCTVTVIASLSDRSYAVESDYYERAVRWDESARERDASALLGWTSAASITTGGSDGELNLVLHDQGGVPITGATVEAEVFHHARRGEALLLTLGERAPGRYAADLSSAPAGVWRVRVRAVLGGSVYVSSRDIVSTRGAS